MKNLTQNLIAKLNPKLSVFEIALTGILLAVAVTAKYFDKFIPHVHPFHIVCLITGITLLRTISATLLVGSYVLITSITFGVEGPTVLASALHTLQTFVLLIICLARIIKSEKIQIRIATQIALIVITMMLYLFVMIIADSEYTRIGNSNVPFWERVRLALIYPGDWMNVTVSTAFTIGISPTVYLILSPFIKNISNNSF